jgi:lipopolysaccharide export system permease protein
MRLLDRYLLRELLLPLGYCLCGFTVFWISFDLFTELEMFQRCQLGLRDVLEYYLVRLPELMVMVLPIAFLLALLYTLTNHARHHEIIAMRGAGLSLWRIGAPHLILGLVFCLVVFYLNEVWVPDTNVRAERIRLRYQTVADNPAVSDWRPLNFKNDRSRRVWNIEAYNLKTFEMRNPRVEWVLPDGTRHLVLAQRALYTNDCWAFLGATLLTYQAGQAALPLRISTNCLELAEFEETPEVIRSEIKISSLSNRQAAKRPQLSIWEIRNYLRLHPHLDGDRYALLNTQLQGRLAEPWTCLVVVLIALPFGAASGRRNAFVGVANSIFICFAYFILLKFGLALGTGGYVPPWLAAWVPNLAFGSLGVTMTQQVR